MKCVLIIDYVFIIIKYIYIYIYIITNLFSQIFYSCEEKIPNFFTSFLF